MTAVLFKFSHPDGTPVVDAPFLVTTRKPSFDETLNNGIQLPGDVEGVTDAQGEATLELMAGFATYYLLMDQPGAVAGEDGCVAGLRYRFMVVESSTTIRVEDLIVTTPTWSRPWDETAIQVILDAKIASIAAADRADEAAVAADASELAAKTSEDNAKLSEDAAKASELVSIDKAGQASVSQLAAKASEDAAQASEDAAKVSELAAAASADFAAGAVVDMQAQVDEATLQAGIATGAATTSTNNAALTAADRDATAADAVATEADKVATAADVVTITGLKSDVTALKDETEGYRDEAMAAVGTLGAVIQDGGPIDLSGGAYPAAPIVSTMWKVTVGGTVPGPQGDTYGIGDTLFYAKDQDLFYKIDNTENVSSVAGKTGAVALVKDDVGLPLVDNTTDLDKPVSTPQQTALDTKIDKTSIVDDLASTDATKVLSAKQGKSLYDLIQANNVTLVVYEFLATAGQTVFSGADTNGLTLLYTPGTGTILLRNGVQLDRGDDYTAMTGSSVTVAQACDLNDLMQVMAFGTFSVANHYTKPEEDALLLTKVDKTAVIALDHGGTGANTQTGARAALGLELVALAAGVNWDTITTPGKYFVPLASGTNAPLAGVNHVVEVTNTPNGLKQTSMLYGNTVTYSRAAVAGSWQGWYKSYDATNMLGTVSQTGGVPTGAIIERGSNAQGSYIRYADGTQICWIEATAGAANNAAGPVYNSLQVVPGAYPAAFSSAPAVTATATPYGAASGIFWVSGWVAPTQSSWGAWLGMSPTTTTAFSTIRLMAIGRWF